MNVSRTRINHAYQHVRYRGKLKVGTKSDIVRCIEDDIVEQDDIAPIVEVVVFVGPAIVYALKPASARDLSANMTRMCSYCM